MSGKENIEQRAALSGSGALSHVYIQHPPLRCSIPETQGLYYDDGNRLLLSPTSGQVLSWKVGSSTTESDPPDSDSIGEGPILFIRYSLDRKLIAIQRSNHEIQFKNRESGDTFSRKYKPESESILGFFWTDCPTCDIVIIKTSGLDLLSCEVEYKRLRLVEAKRLNVSWYVYTHESRMVLLASGMQCNIFHGFQFSSVGIVCLPRFEMQMTKAETNQKPVLSAEDVNLVTIYGRIYCLQIDRVDMQLHVYRFYRDAVVPQGFLPVYSTKIAVSVVDNVLLVHQVDAKVVILYDVFFNSLSPVSAPLPLLVKGTPRGAPSSSQANTTQVVDVEPNALSAYDGIIYGDAWSFLVPDVICDVEHGLLWKIHLDLDAIATSCSDVPVLLEFMQRRRSEPLKVKQLCLALMRAIILERRPVPVIARAINVINVSFSQDRRLQNSNQKISGRITSDSQVSDSGENSGAQKVAIHESLAQTSGVNKSLTCSDSDSDGITTLEQKKTASQLEPDISESRAPRDANENQFNRAEAHHRDHLWGSTVSNIESAQVTSVVISPDEMCYFVFTLVEEGMVGDPAYYLAVIVEFLRSAAQENLKVHKNLYVMMVKLLACSDRHSELGMFILNKIVEPSKEVALQLIEVDHQPARKLGIDMLKNLSLHNEYVQILTQHGYYLEALRYARKNKVVITRPSLYLDAAFSTNNLEHLAAVLRFFSEYTPGFRNTSDHEKYHHILNGMA